jgi:hypothetical protein
VECLGDEPTKPAIVGSHAHATREQSRDLLLLSCDGEAMWLARGVSEEFFAIVAQICESWTKIYRAAQKVAMSKNQTLEVGGFFQPPQRFVEMEEQMWLCLTSL